MAQSPQWKVIHITHSEKRAQEILVFLEEEGILARSRQVSHSLSAQENDYAIMVLGAEAAEAQQMLIERNLLL